jgi:hypothetical protein
MIRWIKLIAEVPLVVFGALGWSVSLEERYHLIVPFGWGAAIAALITLVSPSVEKKLVDWAINMGALLLLGLVFYNPSLSARKALKPKTAAVLGLVLGPLGYLYIGWRFMLGSTASLLVLFGLISIAHLPSPWTTWWVGPVVLLVLAVQAHAACQDINAASEKYSDDRHKRQVADFLGPALMAVGLLFVLMEAYLAALAVSLVAGFALHGRLLRAGAYVLGGVVVVWLVRGIGSVLAPLLGSSLCVAYGKIRGWNGGGDE